MTDPKELAQWCRDQAARTKQILQNSSLPHQGELTMKAARFTAIAAMLERDGDLPPENPQKEYAEWRKRGNKIIDLKRQLAQARRQGREDAADAARFRAITNGISISAEDKRALVVMIPEAQAKAEGTTVLDELRKAIDEVGGDRA